MSSSNVVIGAIQVKGLPEEACFTTFKELLQALKDYLVVEIPRSITNVLFSVEEPAPDQRNYLWVRYNNAGGFVGLYIYAAGAWQLITPVPQGIFWIYGDSDNPPPGYLPILSGHPEFTAAQITFMEAQYYPSGGPAPYSIYAATFIGF